MNTASKFRTGDEQVSEALYGRVMAEVSRARTRAARLRLALSSFFITVSALGSVIAVRATLDAAAATGFSSFASLALTDTSLIAAHAQTFGLSLVETLPGVQIACLLLGLSVLLVSLRSFVHALAQLPHNPRFA